MSLVRHSALNLVGSVVPLVVAIPAMAVLSRELGVAGFGLVGLAWALVGYAGVLDLGLSRAVVREIAVDPNDSSRHANVLSTSVFAVATLGFTAAICLYFAAGTLGEQVSHSSPAFRNDAVNGFKVVTLCIPLLLVTLVLQGFWEGKQNFVESNIQRAITGSLVPILTAVGALLTSSFTGAMLGLLCSRILALGIALGRGRMLSLLQRDAFSLATLKSLLHFGGWLTVTNVVSPVMSYLDRYILAYVRDVSAVGLYSAPAELALKLLVVPVAVTRSLFPKLVRGQAHRDTLRHSLVLIGVTCTPIALTVFYFADRLLAVWLGPDFAGEGAQVLQVLMIGFLLSSFAQVPFTRLQAAGRSEVTAYLHVAQVIPFVLLAVELSSRWGAVGTALAWSIRNGVDMTMLWIASNRLLTAVE